MRPPRRVIVVLLLFVAALLSACSGEPIQHQQSYVFGTLVEISVWDRDEAKAQASIGRVLREFDRLHAVLHAWKASEVTRMNAAFGAGPQPFQASPELAAIVADAQRLALQSGFTFDPGIGAMVELWGFHADEFRPVLPDEKALARLVAAHPSIADVQVVGNAISSRNPAVAIDLGGYAKGYALDVGARMLRADGIENALINIGGNIIAIGEHGDRPWRIGIEHPRKPRSAIATLELYDGEAIGTSGDYQRYIEVGGKRYCHILDPRSGRPVEGVEAVTVIAPRGPAAGTLSDVASKPPFVAGPAGWRAAVTRMGIGNALLIDSKGTIHATATMAKRITLVDQGTNVVVEARASETPEGDALEIRAAAL